MIKYHNFNSKVEAETFLNNLRKVGGMGYMLTMNPAWYQVRELT